MEDKIQPPRGNPGNRAGKGYAQRKYGGLVKTSIVLGARQLEDLEKYCVAHGRTHSDVFRNALDVYFDKVLAREI